MSASTPHDLLECARTLTRVPPCTRVYLTSQRSLIRVSACTPMICRLPYQIRFVAAQVAVKGMGKSSGASSSDSDPRRIDDAHGVYIETSPRTYVLVEKKTPEESPQARC